MNFQSVNDCFVLFFNQLDLPLAGNRFVFNFEENTGLLMTSKVKISPDLAHCSNCWARRMLASLQQIPKL